MFAGLHDLAAASLQNTSCFVSAEEGVHAEYHIWRSEEHSEELRIVRSNPTPEDLELQGLESGVAIVVDCVHSHYETR